MFDQKNALGTGYFVHPIEFREDSSFTSNFTFQITGGLGPKGGDGFTFVLQSDGPTAAGGNGGSLGYTGIDKSVAIRFSTYRSGYSPNAYDYNRVQIIADPPGGGQVGIVSADPLFDLNSGEPRFAWIDYDGKNDVIEVFVSQNDTKPANPLISEPFDLMSFVGTDPTYIGFTAANGSKTNDHNVTRWTFRSDAFPLKANPAGQTYVQELRAALEELEGSIGILTGATDDIMLAEVRVGVAMRRVLDQEVFVKSLAAANERGVGALVDADMEEESVRLRAALAQRESAREGLAIANDAAFGLLSLFDTSAPE